MPILLDRPSTLIVDLDHTLIKTDLLFECLLKLTKKSPWLLLGLFFAGLKGRLNLKHFLSRHVVLDPETLPYNREIIRRLESAKADGQKIVLASASHASYVSQIAEHLKLFDSWHGSDSVNLKGKRKLELIDKLYGKQDAAYWGDSKADLLIWQEVKQGLAVSSNARLRQKISKLGKPIEFLAGYQPSLKLILRQLRWHQWSKNLLLFLPMIMSHQLGEGRLWLDCSIAFVAFSCLASAVYVLNDMLDLESDRLHKTKSKRPFASGDLPLAYGFLLLPLLLTLAVGAAWFLPSAFFIVLGLYLILNLGYSFRLKKIHSLDIVLLASMYSLRVFAGGLATGLAVSDWLLSFSTFFFFGLAVAKRYTECTKESKEAVKSGRGYVPEDSEILISLGVGSSLLSCVILALYFNNPQILALYSHPEKLWLILPLMLYWTTRFWILAKRGQIDSDPVAYAIKDKVTHLSGLLTLLILYLSV